MRNSQQIFGKLGELYLPALESVYSFLNENTFKYGFVIPSHYDELVDTDFPSAMRIYWQEILMMSHMAAATSLLRSRAWLQGACQAIDQGNALAFAACFRGFLEAASDTFEALASVPESLIDNRPRIATSLRGRLNKESEPVLIIEGIEDKLIHFLRARELAKDENAPASHRKKTASDYFEHLEKTRQGPMRALYRELCEFSHPSEKSVFFFLRNEPDGYQTLIPGGDSDFALSTINKHREAVDTAFYCGINVSLILLKVLNEFPLETLHTPFLSHIKFTGTPLGIRIGMKLGKNEW